MSRFLQFLGPLGEPVCVRPDRVDGVREIALYRDSRPGRGSLIVLSSREVFRVQATADQIMDAIEAWHTEHDPKPMEMVVGEAMYRHLDPSHGGSETLQPGEFGTVADQPFAGTLSDQRYG